MRGPILAAAALLAAACNRSPDAVEVERMKQQVIRLLREFGSAEFADIRACPAGQGYSGTIRAGDGNGGRSGPLPFIVVGRSAAIDEDNVAPAQRVQAGSYHMGYYARLQPRCFGETDAAYRARYRSRAMDQCTQGARSAPNAWMIDPNQLCTCMVDSYMRDSSTEQLKAEQNLPQAPERANAAMTRCAQEAAQRAGAPPPGNAP